MYDSCIKIDINTVTEINNYYNVTDINSYSIEVNTIIKIITR